MFKPIVLVFSFLLIIGCKSKPKKSVVNRVKNLDGMVWIPGSTFQMGSEDNQARPDEGPVRPLCRIFIKPSSILMFGVP